MQMSDPRMSKREKYYCYLSVWPDIYINKTKLRVMYGSCVRL